MRVRKTEHVSTDVSVEFYEIVEVVAEEKVSERQELHKKSVVTCKANRKHKRAEKEIIAIDAVFSKISQKITIKMKKQKYVKLKKNTMLKRMKQKSKLMLIIHGLIITCLKALIKKMKKEKS